jgi:hypothetical protein
LRWSYFLTSAAFANAIEKISDSGGGWFWGGDSVSQSAFARAVRHDAREECDGERQPATRKKTRHEEVQPCREWGIAHRGNFAR